MFVFLLATSLSMHPILSPSHYFVVLQVMNLIGDVKGKVAVMVDDMIDTAG